jgi:hypothetical protein
VIVKLVIIIVVILVVMYVKRFLSISKFFYTHLNHIIKDINDMKLTNASEEQIGFIVNYTLSYFQYINLSAKNSAKFLKKTIIIINKKTGIKLSYEEISKYLNTRDKDFVLGAKEGYSAIDFKEFSNSEKSYLKEFSERYN